MAFYHQNLLPPCAEVIKNVQELFLPGWDVGFDACSKGNKIPNSLCDTRAAAVSSTGGTVVLAEVFWRGRTVPEFLQPPRVPTDPRSWWKVAGARSGAALAAAQRVWSLGSAGEHSDGAEGPWGG